MKNCLGALPTLVKTLQGYSSGKGPRFGVQYDASYQDGKAGSSRVASTH
jgi:hypothetical protein